MSGLREAQRGELAALEEFDAFARGCGVSSVERSRRIEELRAALAAPGAADGWVLVPAAFIDFVRHAPVSSGVCCCGDEMDRHGAYSGHSPVDMWDHSLQNWLDEIAKTRPAPPSQKEQDNE